MNNAAGSARGAADVVNRAEPVLIKDSAVTSLVLSQVLSVIGSSAEMMAVMAAQSGDAELERSLASTAFQVMSFSTAEADTPFPFREAAAVMQRLAEVALKG